MTKYLLSVHSDGAGPSEPMTDAQMQQSMQRMNALESEMTAAGALFLSARLDDATNAKVVRGAKGKVLATDGPFVEAKEHLAGFYVVEAADLDAAIGWAAKTSEVIEMPIEVRPFVGLRGA